MGFISSILCCSSDSSQATSKWNSRQLNPRTQQQQQQQLQQVQQEGGSYSQKGTKSNSNTAAATKYTNPTRHRQSTTRPTKEQHQEGGGNINKPSPSQSSNLRNNQELLKMGAASKNGHVSASNGNNRNSNSNLKYNGKEDRQEKPSFGKPEGERTEKEREKDKDVVKNNDSNGISVDDDLEKEQGLQNNRMNRNSHNRSGEVEKQGVYVYTGDTDTSTGGSSYDHHSQFPPSTDTTTTTTTTNSNQFSHSPLPSQDLQETTTTVHEGENASSADDTDVPLQQNGTHEDELDSDMDVDMVPPYDDEEEFVDLTELQPGQFHAPGFNSILPPQSKHLAGKKCLVLDLDETLVHSSFKYLKGADFVLPVDIDDQIHNVYVMKRPGVDEFLRKVGSLFEVVIFTASVARYGDPLLDILDKHHSVHHRLFREACYNYEGNYIKNLSQIGRPLSEIIILDNSPASYIFHPQHAIPISSWFSDTHDNELLDIIPLLEDLAAQSVPDIGKVLDITI